MLSACPDEQTFVDFAAGTLSEGQLALFEAHLNGCADCAQLVVELALQRPAQRDEAQDEALGAEERRLGRYALERILGAGGMGVVWEARDPALGRAVAIKLLRPELGATEQEKARRSKRLFAEARALAALSHPNILTVFDVGEDEGQVWIATELLAGEPLRAGQLAAAPWGARLDALITIAEALHAAHEAGVVHGDIKPDNIILCRNDRLVITDFGLARRHGDISGDHGGTVAYMAPELMSGGGHSALSDQFAFCVMACELLSGVHPFERRDRMATITAIQRGEARLERGKLPAKLWKALERGMSAEPAARFEDMEALTAALRAVARPRRSKEIVPASAALILLVGAALASQPGAAPQRAALPAREAAPAPRAQPQSLDPAIAPASWAVHIAWRSAQTTPPRAQATRASIAPQRGRAPRTQVLHTSMTMWEAIDAQLGPNPPFVELFNKKLTASCNKQMSDLERCEAALKRLDDEVRGAGGAFEYIEARPAAQRAELEANLKAFLITATDMLTQHGRCREGFARHSEFNVLLVKILKRDKRTIDLQDNQDYIRENFANKYPSCARAAWR